MVFHLNGNQNVIWGYFLSVPFVPSVRPRARRRPSPNDGQENMENNDKNGRFWIIIRLISVGVRGFPVSDDNLMKFYFPLKQHLYNLNT